MKIKPLDKSTASFKEKRSTFTGIINPTNQVQSVSDELKRIRKSHHAARHVAWAYRIMNGDQLVENSSDDGEPSGSAGPPILGILRKKNIINATCYVVRYYGGIKLGKRGLIDAYKEAALLATDAGHYEQWVSISTIEIRSEYQYAGRISSILEKNNLSISKELSGEKLHWNVNVKTENAEKLIDEFCSVGEGNIQCKMKKGVSEVNQGGTDD